jgi:hypothetical protein
MAIRVSGRRIDCQQAADSNTSSSLGTAGGICLSEQWRSLTVNNTLIRAASADLLAKVAEAVMDPATQSSAITALAAVAGSIVGGLASFATAYFSRHQARRS